jgi:hypothetical protein
MAGTASVTSSVVKRVPRGNGRGVEKPHFHAALRHF